MERTPQVGRPAPVKGIPPPELQCCFSLADILEDELAGKILPPSERQPAPNEKARLEAIQAKLHRAQRSALCLSGGGIRSATFALGVVPGTRETRFADAF